MLLWRGLIGYVASWFQGPEQCCSCFGAVLISGSAAPWLAGGFDAGFLFRKALLPPLLHLGLVVRGFVQLQGFYPLVGVSALFPLHFWALTLGWGFGSFGLPSSFGIAVSAWACVPGRWGHAQCVHSVVGWPHSVGRFRFSVSLGMDWLLWWSSLFSFFLSLACGYSGSVAAGPSPLIMQHLHH